MAGVLRRREKGFLNYVIFSNLKVLEKEVARRSSSSKRVNSPSIRSSVRVPRTTPDASSSKSETET